LPSALLAEVLLDRVDEVGAADPVALVVRLQDVRQDEHVLEAGGVMLLEVPAARAVEMPQSLAFVAAIDRGSRLTELAIGLRGHAGDGP
jgi:hypothetical protein